MDFYVNFSRFCATFADIDLLSSESTTLAKPNEG